jgi:hypothetical protein
LTVLGLDGSELKKMGDVPRVANTNFVLGRPLSSSEPATFQH